jgi:hypothetical protein
VIAAVPITTSPLMPALGVVGEGTHGVITDEHGVVVINLFQQDYDDYGWWLPGAQLWIPRPVLPHP